ncbi:putative reverse transcriptase domain-containing protein [Tanacetum coccineum]
MKVTPVSLLRKHSAHTMQISLHHHIGHASSIQTPLYILWDPVQDLLFNYLNKKYIWGKDQESAFQLLKQKLCEAPILALPEGNEDFVVYCDASHQGLGAMLMQREKVIAYAS